MFTVHTRSNVFEIHSADPWDRSRVNSTGSRRGSTGGHRPVSTAEKDRESANYPSGNSACDSGIDPDASDLQTQTLLRGGENGPKSLASSAGNVAFPPPLHEAQSPSNEENASVTRRVRPKLSAKRISFMDDEIEIECLDKVKEMTAATTEEGNDMPSVSTEPKEGILKSRTPSTSLNTGTSSLEAEETTELLSPPVEFACTDDIIHRYTPPANQARKTGLAGKASYHVQLVTGLCREIHSLVWYSTQFQSSVRSRVRVRACVRACVHACVWGGKGENSSCRNFKMCCARWEILGKSLCHLQHCNTIKTYVLPSVGPFRQITAPSSPSNSDNEPRDTLAILGRRPNSTRSERLVKRDHVIPLGSKDNPASVLSSTLHPLFLRRQSAPSAIEVTYFPVDSLNFVQTTALLSPPIDSPKPRSNTTGFYDIKSRAVSTNLQEKSCHANRNSRRSAVDSVTLRDNKTQNSRSLTGERLRGCGEVNSLDLKKISSADLTESSNECLSNSRPCDSNKDPVARGIESHATREIFC